MSSEVRTLANGAVMALDTGRIVKGAPLTSGQAKRLTDIREAKRRRAVRRALESHPDCRTDADGLQMIFEAQMEAACTPSYAHGARAATLLLRSGGYMPEHQAAQGSVIQVNVVIQGDVARQLGEIGEIVEGEVRDAE